MATASEKLALAQKHLKRAQTASFDPIDWDDLSLYGFYCLEAAVEAATLHVGKRTTTKHWEKADQAKKLSKELDLPDVADLLHDLNVARKAAAYGDVQRPADIEPDDIANQLEEYVDAVDSLLSREEDES